MFLFYHILPVSGNVKHLLFHSVRERNLNAITPRNNLSFPFQNIHSIIKAFEIRRGSVHVKVYKLTAYAEKGKVIIDESLEAANDEEAKQKGQVILEGKNLLATTHRLASPTGELILFHS